MTIYIYFPHINVIQTYIQGLQRYLTFQNTYFMFLNKKNSSEMLRADFHHIISIGAGILLTFKHVRCQRPESYLSSHWLLTSILMTILIYFPHMNFIQTYRQGLKIYLAVGNTYFMFLKKITLVRCQRPESYLSSHWLLTSVLLTILIYFPHMNVIQTYRQGLHRYVAFGNIYFMFLKKITLVRCQRQKSYLSSHWLLTSVLMTISIYLSHMNNIIIGFSMIIGFQEAIFLSILL